MKILILLVTDGGVTCSLPPKLPSRRFSMDKPAQTFSALNQNLYKLQRYEALKVNLSLDKFIQRFSFTDLNQCFCVCQQNQAPVADGWL